jgi:hypothetical protein
MGKLPHNDSRWLAMRVEIDRREKQTGDRGLSIRDLERDLEAGKRHSMRRNRITGDSELVPASFWKKYCVGYLSPSSVTICRKTDIDQHKLDEYGNLIAECLDDWLFYVWPDFDSTPADHEQPIWPIDRAMAVLLDLFPAKANMPRSLKAAWRDVVKECQERDWQPPSEETVQRAAAKLGYRPPRKQSKPRKRKRR